MRCRRLIAFVVSLIALAGCGGPGDSTPVACLEGAPAYLRALEDVPREVGLGGTTPISECLAENQSGGDLAAVGDAMLTATTKLNAEARAEPGGAASRQLGYLLGAAQRGAERTAGIHTELIRRLSAAARYSPENRSLPAAFYRTYRAGYSAGNEHG